VRKYAGLFASAIDISELSGCLHNGDARNACLHLDACFQYILKRLAATRGDATRELFGSGGKAMVTKSSGEPRHSIF
jgi:hypothetical protein